MNLLPFGKLPPAKPRRFVPENADLGNWPAIAPLFEKLEQRAPELKSPEELQSWLLDWSELNAALDEEYSRRYIAMTCHTDNSDAEKAYLHFVENVEPQLKPRQFVLEQNYTAHPLRRQLPPERLGVFDRDVKNHVELFRPENVSLETEEAKLSQQYQKLSGSLTVNFRGEEKTLPQMGPYQEETDRALRQETWEMVVKRRLQEADNFDDIFDRQIALRVQIAKNTSFANYRDYVFRHMGRFDYTPEDCEKFHDAVEKEIVPIARQLQTQRREQLKLDSLRPWDVAVDPLNRAPLKPFAQSDEMVSRTQKIFNRLDGQLAGGFQQMQDLKLLDLDNRKGKAPGGYQSTLSEAGHAFHALATRDEDLYPYRNAPIEFCEVASMSMELLGNEFIEEFYSSDDARRARRVHLEGVVGVFPWIATVDAFQHWIYTHPTHSREERRKAWLGLMDRFGGDVDWSGLENARANLWHKQLHIFIHPFYYIEYGIAQLGALQVWANSKRDKANALNDYKKSLALGGSRPLPDLFTAAGCQFEFSAKTIQPLAGVLREELAKL
jgi:oligoendopeptidase F